MIIVRLSAQMGNQMFMYANAYALAKETKEKLAIFKFDYTLIYTLHRKWGFFLEDLKLDSYSRYLGIPVSLYRQTINYAIRKILKSKNITEPKYAGKEVDLIEDREHVYSPISLDKSKNVHLLKGFFQSPQYFEKYREDILRQFVPNFELSDETNNTIEAISRTDYPVSIHIRRGDYVGLNACLSLQYYDEATKRIAYLHPNCSFFVFSDDIGWVKKNLNLDEFDVTYVEHEKSVKPFEDIWCMSKCASNIIANSTFSWWGGVLEQVS